VLFLPENIFQGSLELKRDLPGVVRFLVCVKYIRASATFWRWQETSIDCKAFSQGWTLLKGRSGLSNQPWTAWSKNSRDCYSKS